SLARDHESVSRNQRPGHNRRRRDARSRAHPARRAAGRHAGPRTRGRGDRMIRALRYAMQEAVASLWRGRQSGVLSTATIALALFVLGGFLLVTANLAQLGDEWSSAAEMSVYLKDGVSPADRTAIDRALASAPLIAAHEYISKDEALARFRRNFGELSA